MILQNIIRKLASLPASYLRFHTSNFAKNAFGFSAASIIAPPGLRMSRLTFVELTKNIKVGHGV